MTPYVLALAVAAAQQPIATTEVDVSLVVVTVTVEDGDGNFVPGLAASDFVVRDDGVERPVERVREIRHRDEAPVPAIADRPELAGFAQDEVPEEATMRGITFFFDTGNMSERSVVGLRRAGAAAAKWASDTLTPNDRVSIVRFERKETRIIVDDRPYTPELGDILVTMSGGEPGPWMDEELRKRLEFVLWRARELNATDFSSQAQRRQRRDRLVEGLEGLAIRLEGRRGRQIMLYLSEGGFTPDGRTGGGFAASGRTMGYLRTNVLPRLEAAEVTIYSFDTMGLRPPDTRFEGFGPTLASYPAGLGPAVDDSPLASDDQQWRGTAFETVLTSWTGGRQFWDSSGFLAGFEAVGRDIASYYEVTFVPQPSHEPGTRHSIEVDVDRPGVKARHRRGFAARKPAASRDAREQKIAALSLTAGGQPRERRFADLRLLPLAKDEDSAWLGVWARLGPEWMPKSAGEALAVSFHAEVRNHLGAPIAGLDDEISYTPDEAALTVLREQGLEYLGDVEVPRILGEVRVVIGNKASDGAAVDVLQFDLRNSAAQAFVVAKGRRTPRIRGTKDSGAPAGRLTLGGRSIGLETSGRSRPGEKVIIAVELASGERHDDDRVELTLTPTGADDARSGRALTSPRWQLEAQKEIATLLAEGTIPDLEPGPYRLEIAGTVQGKPLATSVPLVVEPR